MEPYFKSPFGTLYNGDVLEVLRQIADNSIDCCITSPPYWALRDYGFDGQIGSEKDFHTYIENLWEIFTEVYRVLKPVATCWVNLGDTYAGSGGTDNKSLLNSKQVYSNSAGIKSGKVKGLKNKSLCNIPARFAIGMTDRGWILRNEIIWHKPNALCTSVKDRFTVDFEKIFFFTKNEKYYFEQQFEPLKQSTFVKAKNKYITNRYNDKKVSLSSDNTRKYYEKLNNGEFKERNKRTVWSMATKGFGGQHFAVFPPKLPRNCIKAGCPEKGTVIDIFIGSGTTALEAQKLNRKWIGIDKNPEYCNIITKRVKEDTRQMTIWEAE